MKKYRLPYSNLELVEDVCSKDAEDIEPEWTQFLGEYVLCWLRVKPTERREARLTSVGTNDCADNGWWTAADAILAFS